MTILELCKQIGIETFGDLQRFKKEYATERSLLFALLKYRIELGYSFRIKEEQ